MKLHAFARRLSATFVLMLSMVAGSQAALAATFTVNNEAGATAVVRLTFTDLSTQYVDITSPGITTADIGSKTISQLEVNSVNIAPTGVTYVSAPEGTIAVTPIAGFTEVYFPPFEPDEE